MPSIQVTGILEDPTTGVESNGELRIISKINYGKTTKNSDSTVVLTSAGAYNFQLAYGKHLIAVKSKDSQVFTNIGTVVVGEGSPSPIDIITLITTSNEEPDPILITKLQIIAAEAAASAEEAGVYASEAGDSAASSELSNQESAANAASTASDKAAIELIVPQVESDRAEVATNTATVQTNTNTVVAKAAEVESDRAEVATNTATVSADKTIVAGYKNEALTAKTEAQRWATGISGSGVNTPSDSNNAFYYSEVARNNANQTFKSGGYFTPTSEQEYPNVTSVEVDTIWLIKFASETGLYTFNTGDLAGQTVKNGFMLVYDTPADAFDYIPTTLSGVTSVNGLVPNAVGNITIDAEAIPAADSRSVQAHVDELVSDVTSNTVTNIAITNNLLKFHPIY